MKTHLKFFGILLIGVFAIFVTSCSENMDRKYYAGNGSISYSVSVLGMPAPKNNVEDLKREAGDLGHNITGIWQGELRFYLGEEAMPYPINIQFSLQGGDLQASSLGKRSEYEEIKNIMYVPPLLTYEYTGHSYKINGEPIPFYAELVVMSSGEIKGLYKQIIAEQGGEQFFAEYDVFMKKSD